MIKKISKLISYNYKLLMVILILITASFLRLYRISEYMTFLGDEGRDVLVVKGILEGNLTLLGPRASAADFFSGPIYYYFMAPFLWLFRYDPVGPAVMIALFGIATVFLVYHIGKEFFDFKAGIFAASLYAVSPLIIAYSRSSWNPNPMPFFSILSLLILYKAVLNPAWKKFLFIGVLSGTAMQLHYQALWLGAVIVVFLFVGKIYKDKKLKLIELAKNYLQLFFGFIIGFSPFLAFEIRHNFPNTRTIINFIFRENAAARYESGASFFNIISNVFFRIFGRLITRFPPPEQVTIAGDIKLWYLGTLVLAVVSILILIKLKNKLSTILLLTWLIIGVALFGFYKRQIHDYYFAFMFPLPFLIVGNFISFLFDVRKVKVIGRILGLIIFAFLLVYNLQGMPFNYLANRQKEQVKMISHFVLSKTNNKPFNFALITGGNSDHSYRYFFELAGRKPLVIENEMIDPERKTVTNQLLVICEIPDCKPLGYPLWEIAGFGRGEIVGEWGVSVVKVFKLEHYKIKD